MRLLITSAFALAASLSMAVAIPLHAQNSADPPPCHADGSNPPGEACKPIPYVGEFNSPKFHYRVQLPEDVTAFSGGPGGFDISLTHPKASELLGPPLSMISVGSGTQTPFPFQQLSEEWAEFARKDSERIYATDLQLDEPEQTSLSSLPALHLKFTRTEPSSGRLVYEEILAYSPDKKFDYGVVMVSPADQYEKNKKLFRAIVDGFSYIPPKSSNEPQ